MEDNLDASTKQLKDLYSTMMTSKEVNDEIKEIFKDVRILVVGRSGSGKSTIIRLVIGEKGPRTICRGTAGVQNILREWHYEDPDLPLTFHDSNGVDVCGQSKVSEIKEFLEKRQKSHNDNFNERVHLVWYVFSASDNRFIDDGGLLEMVTSAEYGLHLLLVMTHDDYPNAFENNVKGDPLNDLLNHIKDPEMRAKVEKEMTRLGNSVCFSKDGSMLPGGKVDVSGLKDLIKKTKNTLHKSLRKTWIACQVIDMDEKIEMSARLIIRRKTFQRLTTCALGSIPIAQQLQLAYMLLSVTRALGIIWKVPNTMKEAILNDFFLREGRHVLIKSFFEEIVGVVGLALAIIATIPTAGVAGAACVGASGVIALITSTKVSDALMTYSLLVLGAILYSRTFHAKNGNWNPSLKQNDHATHLIEFINSSYAKEIKNFHSQYRSFWEGTLLSEKQTKQLKVQLISFLNDLMRERPTSLHSQMKKEITMDNSYNGLQSK